MVDWDLVERRRSKGWDWERIAEDPKVGFQADAAAGDPGRALRALYYQRKSKSKRRSSSSSTDDDAADPEKRWTLERVAAILAPLFAIWFVLALVIPSPVGTFFPAIPWLIILLLGAIAVLAFALLRSSYRWNTAIRNSLVIGVVLGFVFAGAFGVFALVSGCPTLTAVTSGEPSSFQRADNALWQQNGASVFFFMGSAACPYCSASSWAMAMALEAFGSLSGTYFDRSNPGDIYPQTPEIVLANAILQSKYVSLQVAEATDDNAIPPSIPTTGCYESSYVSSYDSVGNIPFVVIGGQYFHVGTMVNPASLQGLTAQNVSAQMSSESGPAWNAISPTGYLLEAFLVKTDGGQPTSVATNPSVVPLLAQIH
jgi:succinate dehydrogenase hydrophobic anchor subunit